MHEQALHPVTPHDRKILRDLARRQVEIANSEANRERRHAWLALDAGAGDRPMILCEWAPAYAKDFELPWLQCEGVWARGLERQFRRLIHEHEVIRDDHVVEPFLDIGWDVRYTDYGVKKTDHHADNAGKLGARSWDPPLKDLRNDLAKLKQRVFSVDREATLKRKAQVDEVFDGVLPTRIRGRFWWTLGMTWPAIDLIGMENLMLFMYDDPDGLHGLMRFLRDDHLRYIDWAEAEGLLTLNNENDYTGSGSMGYTRRLPQPDWKEGDPVRLRDCWALLESQETVGVGPELFAEFIYPYQRDIAGRFGAVYYGCCEPVHTRWDVLKQLPNLRRVSISPWCDQRFMAEALGRDIVFSRKPNPTLISTASFDEAAILADLRETLLAARGCRLEIIMKDVHELAGEPQRAARWVQLARQAASFVGGVSGESRKPPYRVLQQNHQAHILEHLGCKTMAYSFFETDWIVPHGIVRKTDTPVMVMVKEAECGVVLSLADPDLRLPKRRNTGYLDEEAARTPARPSVVRLELHGAWRLAQAPADVRLVDSSARGTTLECGCAHGKTSEFTVVRLLTDPTSARGA